MGWLVLMHWLISQANKWKDYSNYFGERVRISKILTTSHFLSFYGWPWKYVTAGCIIQCAVSFVLHVPLCYSAYIMKLEVSWRSTLPPSWTQLVLTSFCDILNGYAILLKIVPCHLPSHFSEYISQWCKISNSTLLAVFSD